MLFIAPNLFRVNFISVRKWLYMYLQAAASAADLQKWFPDFFQFVIGFYWKWRFWCIPTPDDCDQHPGRGLFFFVESHFWGKARDLVIFQWFFIKMTLNWYQKGELLPELASLTLKNFGGWPKCLKWSSQRRPMTDVVRTNPPQTLHP